MTDVQIFHHFVLRTVLAGVLGSVACYSAILWWQSGARVHDLVPDAAWMLVSYGPLLVFAALIAAPLILANYLIAFGPTYLVWTCTLKALSGRGSQRLAFVIAGVASTLLAFAILYLWLGLWEGQGRMVWAGSNVFAVGCASFSLLEAPFAALSVRRLITEVGPKAM